MLAITRAERTAALLRAAVELVPDRDRPVHGRADRVVERDRAAVRGQPRASSSEEHTSEDLRAIIDQSRTGGAARSRRGGDAVRRLPPPRAGGARGDDPDPGGGHRRRGRRPSRRALRRCVSSGHTRLLVIEDDNPDRVRGVVHNNSLARLYMQGGPDDLDRAGDPRRLRSFPRRSRSTTCSPSCSASELHGRGRGRIRPDGRDRHGRGHPRGGGGRDRGRDRPATTGAVRRLTNGDWYVRGHVPLGDLADVGIELPVDTDAYNSIGGLRLRRAGSAAEARRRDPRRRLPIRVESVRENRIVAVRIHPPRRATPAAEEPARLRRGRGCPLPSAPASSLPCNPAER